jgi:hypothetical protein
VLSCNEVGTTLQINLVRLSKFLFSLSDEHFEKWAMAFLFHLHARACKRAHLNYHNLCIKNDAIQKGKEESGAEPGSRARLRAGYIKAAHSPALPILPSRPQLSLPCVSASRPLKALYNTPI